MHLQKPSGRPGGAFLHVDGAAAQHAGEPGVPGGNDVRVIQRSGHVHSSSGESDQECIGWNGEEGVLITCPPAPKPVVTEITQRESKTIDN